MANMKYVIVALLGTALQEPRLLQISESWIPLVKYPLSLKSIFLFTAV
jgi:hypothetical protein